MIKQASETGGNQGWAVLKERVTDIGILYACGNAPLPFVLRPEPCVVGREAFVGLLGLGQHVGHGLLQGRGDGELHPVARMCVGMYE